jgi:Heterokaryon incompatibility protein (HET)
MNATFTYSPLPPGHIRVLQGNRVCNGAVYELHTRLLDDCLRFRAISYAWGPPALTQSIKCNGEELLVTSSVSELLSSTVISSLLDELPIWIDAICINQRDDAEKAQQVRNMGSLYSLAEEVIVWLGPASSDSDLAMDTIRAMSRRKTLISQANIPQFSASTETLRNSGFANIGREVRCALGSLPCRGWFRRLWIFQEVVLAQRRQVVCGSEIIGWDDFADSTIAISRLQHHQFSIIFPNVMSGLRAIEGIFEMGGAAGILRLKKQELRSAFLMDIAGSKAATDSRDRVFGMLGVASSHLRKKIKVDYSQQDPSATLRLYIDSGKASIEEGSSLGLLYMLSGREKHPGLPSWCPDLDAPQSRKLFLHPEWKAGVKNLPEGERQPSAWFEPGCDDLYAPGCRVDIVSEVVKSTYCWSDMERDGENPSGEDGANNLLWESECLALARQTFTQQGDVPDAYILTLCEGFLNPYENDPYMIREAYKRNISLWHHAAKSIPHEDVDQRLRSAAHHLESRLMRNCQGRKFFTTNRGRIGVGPPETQAGDEVYILYGAGPLYLLRSEDDAIKILGNVHIHELMNLEETPEDTMEENEIVVLN